jgi:hypothetical protein
MMEQEILTTEDTEEHGGKEYMFLISSVFLCALCG